MRRRAFLVTCLAAGLAGCSGDEGSVGSPDDGATPTQTAGGTPTAPAAGGAGGSSAGTATGRPAAGTPETGRTPSRTVTATGPATPTPIHPGYETTEVRVTTPEGDLLGSVTAAIADTPDLRYTGLSDTESLPKDRGMLFVYESVDDHTYVMRRMDFGLDIVYADDEGVITSIHHASAPGPDEDGEDQAYPGRGQYVLEVDYEWTTERGVETGDVLRFDL
jgi:uncharacterized membrane protein (UPF0127 family)